MPAAPAATGAAAAYGLLAVACFALFAVGVALGVQAMITK